MGERGSVILGRNRKIFAARSTASCSGRSICPTEDLEVREERVIRMSLTRGFCDSESEMSLRDEGESVSNRKV